MAWSTVQTQTLNHREEGEALSFHIWVLLTPGVRAHCVSERSTPCNSKATLKQKRKKMYRMTHKAARHSLEIYVRRYTVSRPGRCMLVTTEIKKKRQAEGRVTVKSSCHLQQFERHSVTCVLWSILCFILEWSGMTHVKPQVHKLIRASCMRKRSAMRHYMSISDRRLVWTWKLCVVLHRWVASSLQNDSTASMQPFPRNQEISKVKHSKEPHNILHKQVWGTRACQARGCILTSFDLS